MFGTDGIRGRANNYPMLPHIVLSLGKVIAWYFDMKGISKTGRVIIGKDTRLSGYLFENTISAGLLSMGKEVYLLGPVPTPGVAFLTKSMRADFGIMITASHNPFYDNGIKIFNSEGFKLTHLQEAEIEDLVTKDLNHQIPITLSENKIGRAYRLKGVAGRYLQLVKSTFPDSIDLSHLRIVLDCANGASYKLAPDVLYELRAKEVIPIGISPNGTNINNNCGSTHIDNAIRKLKETKADLAISVDGDADRLVMVDEQGEVLDGDTILAIIADYWHQQGLLKNNIVVGTITSSLSLERFLNKRGIELIRVDVGDKNIIEYMRTHDAVLGGENSGHTILLNSNTNSDAIITCLEVLKIMILKNKTLHELNQMLERVDSISGTLDNVGNLLENPQVAKELQDIHDSTAEKCRMVVRKSGTEDKIRILVEGDNAHYNQAVYKQITSFLKNYLTKLDN